MGASSAPRPDRAAARRARERIRGRHRPRWHEARSSRLPGGQATPPPSPDRARAAPPIGFACLVYVYLTLPDVRPLRTANPSTTAFMALRDLEAHGKGMAAPRRVQRWVSYSRISPDLKRAPCSWPKTMRSGSTRAWISSSCRSRSSRLGARPAPARRQHDHAAAREEPVSLAVEESRCASSASSSSRGGSRRAEEGADLRALSERDRVGRRDLRRRGGRARPTSTCRRPSWGRRNRRCSPPRSSTRACSTPRIRRRACSGASSSSCGGWAW